MYFGELSALPGSLAVSLSRFGFAILAFADGSGLPFSLHPPLAALESQLCKVRKAVTECTARERPWLPLFIRGAVTPTGFIGVTERIL